MDDQPDVEPGAACVENTWVVMPDGERLAATLYLPFGSGSPTAVPCLLEALPYRKDDVTASYRPEYVRFRDEHGYAVARVDLRGTGSSTGIALDEYHPQEQADLHAVIAWLADQPWCTGSVGMFGTSWSGFNSLQMACERPPALESVVAIYATDDRWTDDVHYMGGAMRLLDQVDWPLFMVASNALPPVPAVFGDGWREEWRRRLDDGGEPWLLRWLREQTDGPYWRHGSVRAAPGSTGPSYERITCPTMIIAGWADGYRNNTFRTFRALQGNGTPVRVLAGPWSHMSPEGSVPGPRVDHVPLMAAWFDRWLRKEPNGVDHEPGFVTFVRGFAPPSPDAAEWPGRWEAHDAQTLAAREPLDLRLGEGVATYLPARDVGLRAWNSCAASLPWGQPQDQTEDDARSLCVEWDVPQGSVVLGNPSLHLRVRPDSEIAFVSAKLSLVPSTGRPSLLVDRGLLNLSYRDGDSTSPRACVPGEWVDVTIGLEATSFEVTAGPDGAPCRLRLALACADWPNTVAPPGSWSAVDLGASWLSLPVSRGTPHPAPRLPAPKDPPAPSAEPASRAIPPRPVLWQHGHDVLSRTTWAEVDHGGVSAVPYDADLSEVYRGRVEIDGDAAQQATATCRLGVAWPGVEVSSQADLRLDIDDEAFDARVDLEVLEGSDVVWRRSWHERIPRRLG